MPLVPFETARLISTGGAACFVAYIEISAVAG